MSENDSKAASEYAFPDQDDLEDNQERQYSIAIQRMDTNVRLVLSNFALDDEVFERFAAHNVRYADLAGFSAEDLVLFGVTDEALQDEMLRDFRMCEGQAASLEVVMHDYRDASLASRREMTVIDLLQTQLSSLNTLLAATMLKVGASTSSQSPGVVVNSNFNSPLLVLDMLEKMTHHAEEMTKLVQMVQDNDQMEKHNEEVESKSRKDMIIGSIISASIVIIGLMITNHIRGSRKFW